MDPKTWYQCSMRNHETSYQVAQRVVEVTRERGVTPADLAEILGRPLTTTYRRLSGTTPFTVAELLQVAEALDLPVSALVEGTPEVTTR